MRKEEHTLGETLRITTKATKIKTVILNSSANLCCGRKEITTEK